MDSLRARVVLLVNILFVRDWILYYNCRKLVWLANYFIFTFDSSVLHTFGQPFQLMLHSVRVGIQLNLIQLIMLTTFATSCGTIFTIPRGVNAMNQSWPRREHLPPSGCGIFQVDLNKFFQYCFYYEIFSRSILPLGFPNLNYIFLV